METLSANEAVQPLLQLAVLSSVTVRNRTPSIPMDLNWPMAEALNLAKQRISNSQWHFGPWQKAGGLAWHE